MWREKEERIDIVGLSVCTSSGERHLRCSFFKCLYFRDGIVKTQREMPCLKIEPKLLVIDEISIDEQNKPMRSMPTVTPALGTHMTTFYIFFVYRKDAN